MGASQIWTLSPSALVQRFKGRILVINVDTGTVFETDEAGGRVLSQLRDRVSHDELFSRLDAEVGSLSADERRYVEEFLAELVEARLVTAEPEGGGGDD